MSYGIYRHYGNFSDWHFLWITEQSHIPTFSCEQLVMDDRNLDEKPLGKWQSCNSLNPPKYLQGITNNNK
jgi:hypothetical protein